MSIGLTSEEYEAEQDEHQQQVDALEAKIERLTGRGIEDMKDCLARYEKALREIAEGLDYGDGCEQIAKAALEVEG